MKTTYLKISFLASILFLIAACNKSETAGQYDMLDDSSAAIASDSISSVASLKVKDRQFIKNASVDMEVEDVYKSTIAIEKIAKDFGGFTINSQLINKTESEETFALSDEKAMLVKKFRSGNSMSVKVPTQNLADFLSKINDSNLFLNSRIINAEDVTHEIKYAALEANRIKENSKNIAELKASKSKTELNNDNNRESNYQQLQSLNTNFNIKYSTVDIELKEPSVHIAQLPIANTKNVENQYKISFIYDIKNSFVEGFYFLQLLLIGVVKLWPILLLVAGYFIYKQNRKQKQQPTK